MSWSEALFLKKIIKGQKKFVASDVPIVVFINNSNSYSMGENELGFFVPKSSGTCRLNWEYKSGGSASIQIYEDGNFLTSMAPGDNEYDDYYSRSIDFNLISNKKYDIKIKVTSGYVMINSVTLSASTIDSAMYSYSVN